MSVLIQFFLQGMYYSVKKKDNGDCNGIPLSQEILKLNIRTKTDGWKLRY